MISMVGVLPSKEKSGSMENDNASQTAEQIIISASNMGHGKNNSFTDNNNCTSSENNDIDKKHTKKRRWRNQ